MPLSYEDSLVQAQIQDEYPQVFKQGPSTCYYCGAYIPYSIHSDCHYCFQCSRYSNPSSSRHHICWNWINDPELPESEEGQYKICSDCGSLRFFTFAELVRSAELDTERNYCNSAEFGIEVVKIWAEHDRQMEARSIYDYGFDTEELERLRGVFERKMSREKMTSG